MKGLQISEKSFKKISNTELLRIESEFYTSKTFSLKNYFQGQEIIDFVQYGTSEELNEDGLGYPVLRLNEFDSYFIGVPAKYCNKINGETFENLKLNKGDVLICRTNGNPKLVGKSALVNENVEYAYASYLFKIRPDLEKISPATLVAFLNGKYGRMEIEKYSMQGNQSNFSPAKFREIRIPNLSKYLNSVVNFLFENSFSNKKTSQLKYFDAEQLLLNTLGLKDFQATSKSVNVKLFKESFLSTGRLDAEFYQPKYEEMIEIIKRYKNGYKKLEDFIENYSTGYPYKSETYTDKGIPLIRINNIGKGILDLTNAVNIPQEDEKLSPKDIAKEDDILISMSGTIGNSCKIPKGIKALVNQRIMRFTPRDINCNTLPLIINSIIGESQLNRIGTGGVQTNISATDICNILIPNIENNIQEQIATLVQESYSLKVESDRLLEIAKRAIEITIEENEEVAIDFINKNN